MSARHPSFNWTIERDEAEPHWTLRPPFDTYEHFAAMPREFDGPLWRRLWSCLPPRRVYGYPMGDRRAVAYTVDWRRLVFELRILVPDADGWFDHRGSYCLPWNWKRRYYERRVLARRPAVSE